MKIANLKISTQLAASFSIVLVLLALIVGIGSWHLQNISGTVSTMVDDVMQKERLFAEWAESSNINGARTISVAESNDAARAQQTQAKIKETSEAITVIQKKLDSFNKSPEEIALLSQVESQRKVYIAAREEVFKEKRSDEEHAHSMIQSKLEPALASYVAAIKKLSIYQKEALNKTAGATREQSHSSMLLLNVIGAIAIVFGIAIAIVITTSIKNQLGGEPKYAVDIANRIAQGDLTLAISTKNGDRASLLYAIKAMRDSIAVIVGQVRNGTDLIATASSQIAAGNQDLSSRTEHQASSLEQTAASMDELTGTVKQNADNARQANQLAASASDVAVKGGQMVAQVVTTMTSINESSKRIVDIIGVIDGIAFQTNILALNAAVEAARAGEQGRGFAVVAAEVRSLAQRSAAAAKEIKILIGDSVEKVDAGARLVDQTGATMGEIVDSVKRVTDIMGEITSASHEQTTGLEQINIAISQMDQVTQQNAALVEEAAAAAESLQDQASTLLQVVSAFKLDGSALAASPRQLQQGRPAPALTRTKKEPLMLDDQSSVTA